MQNERPEVKNLKLRIERRIKYVSKIKIQKKNQIYK